MSGYILLGQRGAALTPPPPPVTRYIDAVEEPWMCRGQATHLGAWIAVNGESGMWANRGGKQRDYPTNAPVSGEWTTPYYNAEIANAINFTGLDGLWLDITNPRPTDGAGNYQRILKLITAGLASATPFCSIPMLDINGGAFNGVPSVGTSSAMQPEDVATQIATDFCYNHACLRDGVYQIASFKAEGDSTGKIAGMAAATYWRRFLAKLRELVTDHPIEFTACILYPTSTNFKAFAEETPTLPRIADTMSIWGPANPAHVSGLSTWADLARSWGAKWKAPVRLQDERHYSSQYAEPENSKMGRLTWDQARADDADGVLVVTNNDYAESTQVQPSINHGLAASWFTKFQGQWYRAGSMPAITADKIILTNRIHSTGAVPTTAGINTMNCTLDGGGTHPYDKTEALVFATATSTLFINGVSQGIVPAGMTAKLANTTFDALQTATLVRSGSTVASVSSAVAPHNPPTVPDYDVRWAISA